MKNEKNGGIIAIIFFIVMLFLTYSQPERDVVHDSDGVLGYSDSFWEWVGEQ